MGNECFRAWICCNNHPLLDKVKPTKEFEVDAIVGAFRSFTRVED
jgi:hypothetical protein